MAKPVFPFDVRANIWMKGVEWSLARGNTVQEASDNANQLWDVFAERFGKDYVPQRVKSGGTKIRTDDAPLTDAEAQAILNAAPKLDS